MLYGLRYWDMCTDNAADCTRHPYNILNYGYERSVSILTLLKHKNLLHILLVNK